MLAARVTMWMFLICRKLLHGMFTTIVFIVHMIHLKYHGMVATRALQAVRQAEPYIQHTGNAFTANTHQPAALAYWMQATKSGVLLTATTLRWRVEPGDIIEYRLSATLRADHSALNCHGNRVVILRQTWHYKHNTGFSR